MSLGTDIVAELRDRAREAFGAEAGTVRDELRRLIGVPVQRQGKKLIRSRPGEPPRTETGRLRNSIASAVEVTAAGVTAAVFTDVFYGPFLQSGTSRMSARPYFDVTFDRFERAFIEQVDARMFSGKQ